MLKGYQPMNYDNIPDVLTNPARYLKQIGFAQLQILDSFYCEFLSLCIQKEYYYTQRLGIAVFLHLYYTISWQLEEYLRHLRRVLRLFSISEYLNSFSHLIWSCLNEIRQQPELKRKAAGYGMRICVKNKWKADSTQLHLICMKWSVKY